MSQQTHSFDVKDGIVQIFNAFQPQIFQLEPSETFQSLSKSTQIFQQDTNLPENHPQTTQLDITIETGQTNEQTKIEQEKKKRNTQNYIRMTTRKLRTYLSPKWHIEVDNFYTSPKHIDLLAIFKKQSQCGSLSSLQDQLIKQFNQILKAQQNSEEKIQKQQIYLNFLLGLTQNDLSQDHLENTLKQMSAVAQFKRHPYERTIQQLKQIQSKILPKKTQ